MPGSLSAYSRASWASSSAAVTGSGSTRWKVPPMAFGSCPPATSESTMKSTGTALKFAPDLPNCMIGRWRSTAFEIVRRM